MIDFDPNDKNVTVEEIESLMEIYDKEGVFSTRFKYRKNFYTHFIRLISSGHVMTFREDNKLIGFCSWLMTDKQGKRDINKAKWLIPENIDDGSILYIDTCLTTHPNMVNRIKDNLRFRFNGKVEEVYWFNISKGKVFQLKLKGEKLCLTAA